MTRRDLLTIIAILIVLAVAIGMLCMAGIQTTHRIGAIEARLDEVEQRNNRPPESPHDTSDDVQKRGSLWG